jgi:hypothetical protein
MASPRVGTLNKRPCNDLSEAAECRPRDRIRPARLGRYRDLERQRAEADVQADSPGVGDQACRLMRPYSVIEDNEFSLLRSNTPSICVLKMCFLLGVSAGHQGGAGTTGGGCLHDTRVGVRLTLRQSIESGVAHRP